MKLVIALLVLIMTVTGCGFKDIDKRFFVVGIGIDRPKDKSAKFRVSLKLAIPGNQIEMGSEKYELYTQEADSVTEAVRLIKSKVDKELDFGHAKIAVLGESILNENLDETTDWLLRRRDVQMVAWVAVGKPSAEAVLATQTAHERLPGNSLLLSFGKTGVESAYIVSEYLFDFYRKKKEWGLDPILPVIQASKQQYTINTAVLFDRHRAKLTLTPDETRLFNIIQAYVNKVEIAVPMKGLTFYASIDRITTKFRIHSPRGEQPHLDMYVQLKGVIEESFQYVSPEELPEYEKAAEQIGKERITAFLTKLQKANLDPFGFGLNYRAHHFGSAEEEWEEWQRIYPSLDIRVHEEVKLQGTGTIK